MTRESVDAIVDAVRDGLQAGAGLDDFLLGILADLAMDLGGLAVLGEEVVVPQAGVVAGLFIGDARGVLVRHKLARCTAGWKELGNRHSWRSGLLKLALGLGFLLPVLTFLLFVFA